MATVAELVSTKSAANSATRQSVQGNGNLLSARPTLALDLKPGDEVLKLKLGRRADSPSPPSAAKESATKTETNRSSARL